MISRNRHQVSSDSGVNVGRDVHGDVIVGYTIEQHEAALRAQSEELRQRYNEKSAAEKKIADLEIKLLAERSNSIKISYDEKVTSLTQTIYQLQYSSENFPDELLLEAISALQSGDIGQADTLFARIEDLQGVSPQWVAASSFERGKLAYVDARLADAAAHFEKAASAQPTFNRLFWARLLMYKLGDYKKAFDFGEQLIAQAKLEFGGESVQYATSLQEHSQTLHSLGNLDVAERLARLCIKLDGISGASLAKRAVGFDTLACILRDRGKHLEAQRNYIKSVELSDKSGITDLQSFKRMHNYGSFLADTKQTDEAERILSRVVADGEKLFGDRNYDFPVWLNSLCRLLLMKGKFEESLAVSERALGLAERVLQPDHIVIVAIQEARAMGLVFVGRMSEARPLLEKVERARRSHGAPGPHEAEALRLLLALTNNQGGLGDAVIP